MSPDLTGVSTAAPSPYVALRLYARKSIQDAKLN
jgi:hypothetical protein